MRKCPSCAYPNVDSACKCGICGRDISSVAAAPAQQPAGKRQDSLLLASGFLLLGCAAGFYLLQGRLIKVQHAAPAVSAGDPFKYSGVISSLEAMAGLRYLPDPDQLGVLPLLHSRDENVACAAARAVGTWARSGKNGKIEAALLNGLIDASVSGHGRGRRQAAVEAGFALASRSFGAEFVIRARNSAAALVGEDSAEIKAAGFFLFSMSGSDDFAPQLREVLAHSPLPASKLYAACALSRLGGADGHAYLARVVRGGDPASIPEAVLCLSYSASPAAESLLLQLSKAPHGGAAAESAKRALMLRKQLAIIKK